MSSIQTRGRDQPLDLDGEFRNFEVKFRRRLSRIAWELTHNEADAEELAQAAVVKVWERRERYREGPASFSTWAYTVAVNEMRDQLKKVRRRQREVSIEQGGVLRPDAFLNELFVEGNLDVEALLSELAKRLPKVQMDALRLDMEGFSRREISDRFGVSENTIKSRLASARRGAVEVLSTHREG
jgi:RNA polymerase sigma-70 factor (ECF subfamily)